jgi:predicted flavoprotein YhiN
VTEKAEMNIDMLPGLIDKEVLLVQISRRQGPKRKLSQALQQTDIIQARRVFSAH